MAATSAGLSSLPPGAWRSTRSRMSTSCRRRRRAGPSCRPALTKSGAGTRPCFFLVLIAGRLVLWITVKRRSGASSRLPTTSRRRRLFEDHSPGPRRAPRARAAALRRSAQTAAGARGRRNDTPPVNRCETEGAELRHLPGCKEPAKGSASARRSTVRCSATTVTTVCTICIVAPRVACRPGHACP